ncbi:MAG: hypothetical protein FJ276_09130, partial [Planctomycetes bacterium]|nr:hypothetical protein [Planctomycetota bacterium]
QWLTDHSCLVINSWLTSASDGPTVVPDRLPLLDWTLHSSGMLEAARYRALTHREDVWYGSSYWTGPDWTRVGKDWHHPGTDTPSVRRFTVPRSGLLTITGRIYKADTNNGGGDGVRLEIRQGQETLWQAEIDGGDAQGVEPLVRTRVREGDAIRFVVHKRGHITCDTTHWDPTVTYEDGTSFQASSGFSPDQRAGGVWSYEMEVGSHQSGEPGQITVRGFGEHLDLCRQAAVAGGSAGEVSPAAVPLWIVSDAADAGGMLLAVGSDARWRLACALDDRGDLRLRLAAPQTGLPRELRAGDSLSLPTVIVAGYVGNWLAGATALQRLVEAESSVPQLGPVRAAVARLARDSRAWASAPASATRRPELDLLAMVQSDWEQQDQVSQTASSYAAAALQHVERARRLAAELHGARPGDWLADELLTLDRLATEAHRADLALADARSLYVRSRWLKRHIAFSNPLMDVGSLLFCKRVPTSYSHLVMQYFGWRARPGGGLFVLDRPGYSLKCRDILAGQLEDGNVLEPRLSYDGREIVFSFVRCGSPVTSDAIDALDNDVDERFYHIWKVNVDGSGLHQLTAGPYDDLMPTWLPDGGIAFSSTRRRGHARCFGGQFSRRWHVYTLHRMDADGGDLRILSAHDTNEWFPAVSNTGHILYSRWDYIDRDAVTHQNLWAMRPDGTNPIAVWGNATESPHCTFQAQAIPGSGKIVFTASAHHSITAGSIAIVDPSVSDNGQRAIARLTPEIPFPEAEGQDIRQYYAAPWPLSEEFHLVAFSPQPLVWEPGANAANALGIYLLDAWGNRELIYRDPDIGSTNPCPLRPRPMPPVVGSLLPLSPEPEGEVVLLDVYEGLGDVPRGTIKQLRVIQILPKTTHVANTPPIGEAREENARAVLGTVPVESDGSARFVVPALKPILFQALDEDGFAYQTMRTITYVQPGETVACYGCHENRRAAPRNKTPLAIALARPPSAIERGPLDGRPFSYMEVVQPVLTAHCVRCHGPDRCEAGIDLSATPHQSYVKSYWSLCKDRDFWDAGTNPKNAAEALVPRFGGRNKIQVTPPGGQYGARGSRLISMLRAGHEDVRLSRDDLRRLATWIDCNAIFYGVYLPEEQARQLTGEPVGMPDIQ